MRAPRGQRCACGATAMWLAALSALLSDVVRRRIPADVPSSAHPAAPPFERLQQLLGAAALWPAGPTGDVIRRAACEFIEAESPAERDSSRRRMLKTIAGVQWRRGRRRLRADDPCETSVERLSDALRSETPR